MNSNKPIRFIRPADKGLGDNGLTENDEVATPKEHPASKDTALDGRETADALGTQLRRSYDRLLTEPVPQKFLDLLKQLDQKQAGSNEPAPDTTVPDSNDETPKGE